jgi:hypothetical protein
MIFPTITWAALSGMIPSGGSFAPLVVLVALPFALVFYALWRKGDVIAAISHGSTHFKLEAKDRKRHVRRPRGGD